MTFLEKRSTITARYEKPDAAGMQVMSPAQTDRSLDRPRF
jgi:hypothetical protein